MRVSASIDFSDWRPVEAFLHQLCVAEDGSEWGSQLVAHVGDELRLVLARDLKFSALLGDLLEQTHILDGNQRLVGEGLNQLDLRLCERLDSVAGH